MGREAFTSWTPRSHNNQVLLAKAVEVIDEYEAQGYQLTLRQLYYQLVARDIIPNESNWYKQLGEVVSNGRLGGHIDWDSIVDRGRNPVMPSQWDSPAEILQAAADGFRLDRWKGQRYHVEVWCEKDALSGVIEPVCQRYHVRFLANRGYSSSTAMYDAAQRFQVAASQGQSPVVLYLGDHDPSGLDMSRDVQDRLDLLTYEMGVETFRLALNYPQVSDYSPPPNPTKIKDSRAKEYIGQYGMESWELDALEPQVLDGLISDAIEQFLDPEEWELVVAEEEAGRQRIREAAKGLKDAGSTCDPDEAIGRAE